jgi:hypothetical protein
MFIDGAAALFAVLSASVAVGAIVMAFVGISHYRSFKRQLFSDLESRLEEQLERRTRSLVSTRVASAVQQDITPAVAAALEDAQRRMGTEMNRLIAEAPWREELVAELERRVLERINPQAPEARQDEFDDPNAAAEPPAEPSPGTAS